MPAGKRYCREPGCSTEVVFAVLAPTRRGATPRWGCFEARDLTPFGPEVTPDVRVIVSGSQAWKPADLIEDYQVRHELPTDRARDLVAGYPFHHRHIHPKEPA